MKNKLVDVKQAAMALAMAPTSLYRLAKAGRVPSYSAGPCGRGVRFDLDEVKDALRRPAHQNQKETEPCK